MKVGAIIAEYNPFHNGHKYQIEQAKKELGLDYLIILMSQDVVQRGTFASFDKYWRAEKALEAGADLVLGLPTIVSSQSAEFFAKGAVDILNKLPIDYLIFGAETDNLEALERIAEKLTNEDEAFKTSLNKHLKSGKTFAKSRFLALKESSPELDTELLNLPNNILAVEYLKALEKTKSQIKPYLIKREKNNYHDKNIEHPLASATAVRESLNTEKEPEVSVVPYPYRELKEHFNSVDEDNLYTAFISKLLSSNKNDLLKIAGINEDFLNRLLKSYLKSREYSELVEALKTKNISRTTVDRIFFNILLNLTNNDLNSYYLNDYNPYLRVLGFNKERINFLKNLNIPIVTNVGKDKDKLDTVQKYFLDLDIKTANLRSLILNLKNFNQDYYIKPIIK